MSVARERALHDYKAKNMTVIRNAIQEEVDEGKRRFAIMPMGYWGKVTKEILGREFCINPEACFDNYVHDGCSVYPISIIKKMDLSNITFFIAIEEESIRTYLYQQVIAYIPDASIKLITLCNNEEQRICESLDKIKLDFLCTGFHKCGTTSLYSALQDNPYIFLPPVKESFFATQINESSHKKFKQNYRGGTSDRLTVIKGGIEPTYTSCAASVRNYFGEDLKILFLVRNPVEALKSAFKMSMREADEAGFELIKKYKKVCTELMKEYIDRYWHRFIYIDFIHIYERYYRKEQIQVILQEELIQDTTLQMDKIQKFIGLSEKQRKKYEKFPLENKGSKIFKNLGDAYINNALNMLRMQVDDIELYKYINKTRRDIFDMTTVEFDFSEYANIWEHVWDYYASSVTKLEKRLGRTLKGIWY